MVAALLAAGVKVALHVRPPLVELTGPSEPLATVRSALLKPVTGSVKVIVTVVVSPADSTASANTMVAPGRAVSIANAFDAVVPVPLLPAKSVRPVLASVIRLPALVVPAAGVKVALQVRPPSSELTALSVPLATARSALLKPVTCSEKVIVTSVVWPAVRTLSTTVMLAVGATVSIA